MIGCQDWLSRLVFKIGLQDCSQDCSQDCFQDCFQDWFSRLVVKTFVKTGVICCASSVSISDIFYLIDAVERIILEEL